jgi:HEAT repeat protein
MQTLTPFQRDTISTTVCKRRTWMRKRLNEQHGHINDKRPERIVKNILYPLDGKLLMSDPFLLKFTSKLSILVLICLVGVSIWAFPDSTDDGANLIHLTPRTVDDVNRVVAFARVKSGKEKQAFLNTLSRPSVDSDSRVKDAYLALLDDKDPDIHDAAIVACGNLNDLRAVPKIRMILKSLPKHTLSADIKAVMQKQTFDEEYTHGIIAAETLAKMKDTDALPEILSRDTLAVSWSAIIPPYGASALPQLIQKARSSDPRIKMAAMTTINSIHDPAAASQLQALLSDNDNSIRDTAVLALSNIELPQAILNAESVYNQLDDEGKAYFVEGCLKNRHKQMGLKYLKQYMASNDHVAHRSVHRTQVLMSLAASLQSESIPYLEEYLNDKDPAVREEAACQLAKITGRLYAYPEDNTTRYLDSGCEAMQKLKANK